MIEWVTIALALGVIAYQHYSTTQASRRNNDLWSGILQYSQSEWNRERSDLIDRVTAALEKPRPYLNSDVPMPEPELPGRDPSSIYGKEVESLEDLPAEWFKPDPELVKEGE